MSAECIRFCEGCPFAEMAPGMDGDVELKNAGERIVPRAWVESDGSSAHFEIDYEYGPRESHIAMLLPGSDAGVAIWVPKERWESGQVKKAFEECPEPKMVRTGIFRLGKRAVCQAMPKLK